VVFKILVQIYGFGEWIKGVEVKGIGLRDSSVALLPQNDILRNLLPFTNGPLLKT
jgi:hypothetical protein